MKNPVNISQIIEVISSAWIEARRFQHYWFVPGYSQVNQQESTHADHNPKSRYISMLLYGPITLYLLVGVNDSKKSVWLVTRSNFIQGKRQ